MDLSELIDELREIKIYETDPKDWMGVLRRRRLLGSSSRTGILTR
jgi:hypothetical protein